MSFNSLIQGYGLVSKMEKAFGILCVMVSTGVDSGVVRVIHFLMSILEM
jgi:pentatricopeptide repeat protein